MKTGQLWFFDPDRPKLYLTLQFITWKLLLLCVALASPGPGYDTSTSLALGQSINYGTVFENVNDHLFAYSVNKLTRWDAIYFTQIAHGGYTFEQQWMAGWGFTGLLNRLSIGFGSSQEPSTVAAITGVLVAHISHLLSVLVLHSLGLLCLRSFPPSERSSMASIAAGLHIISPAGMFLSAPYAESPFSLMNLSGYYLYAKSTLPSGNLNLPRGLLLASSGVLFGLATLIRGNGLLSGLIFVHEAINQVTDLIFREHRKAYISRLVLLVFTGTLMGCIAAFPQYLAFHEYCTPSAKRPWCSKWLPSIYGWVQSKYWGVGLFKYWTLSNLPLFFLAAPMLYIIFVSGLWALINSATPAANHDSRNKDDAPEDRGSQSSFTVAQPGSRNQLLLSFAIPQAFLAILAFTTYHVQIITRLSSGYPVWYWWLATMVIEDSRLMSFGRSLRMGALVVRWMCIYAIVQGGLFASFLPPA